MTSPTRRTKSPTRLAKPPTRLAKPPPGGSSSRCSIKQRCVTSTALAATLPSPPLPLSPRCPLSARARNRLPRCLQVLNVAGYLDQAMDLAKLNDDEVAHPPPPSPATSHLFHRRLRPNACRCSSLPRRSRHWSRTTWSATHAWMKSSARCLRAPLRPCRHAVTTRRTATPPFT